MAFDGRLNAVISHCSMVPRWTSARAAELTSSWQRGDRYSRLEPSDGM